MVDLNLVDFSITNHEGRSIFGILMQQGIGAFQKNHPLLGNLMSQIEESFFFLISAAEENLDEERVDRILESPDNVGETVFLLASLFSEKISGWILDRNIDVAFVDFKWFTPLFIFQSNVEKMLKKGINPFVVAYFGKSGFEAFPRNFERIDQNLLKSFLKGNITGERTEAYYSFHDSECTEKCESSCQDKMLRFKLYTGKRKFKNKKTGGEGIVSFGTWHQEPAAFKSFDLGKIEIKNLQKEIISNAGKTRAEFETISKLSHPNILKVFHVFRHQKTKKRNEIRSLENSTVIVMERHDKNIGELKAEERTHMPDLLQDVLEYVQNNFHPHFTCHTNY